MRINEIREGDLVKIVLGKSNLGIVPVIERAWKYTNEIELTFLHKGKKCKFTYADDLDLSLTNCVGVYRNQLVTVYEQETEKK